MSKALEMVEKLDEVLAPIEEKVAKREEAGEISFYEQYIQIPTADYLRALAAVAINIEIIPFYDGDREARLDGVFGVDKWGQDNTYNRNEPYSNDMEERYPKDRDEDAPYRIAFAPHYGGDVRGNYGDFIVFTFNDYYDYIDASDEFYAERGYDFELDGSKYHTNYTGSGEDYILDETEQPEDGSEPLFSDGFTPEPFTEEDFLRSVKEFLAKKS